MPTGLKRDLGLLPTMAIAIGAMVGSGIFILPGIAYEQAGPAAVLAFLFAGLLVLPAAFSASEMATAMPEDGGTYVYVERGMGPLLGTIAGVGNWFALSFKAGLALVGGVPYLIYVQPELAAYILPIGLGLAALFTVLNVVSTKSTGSLQFAIVGLMLLAMVYFVAGGIPSIDTQQTTGSFDPSSEGLIATIGLVFVSYAGVVKIAAVAEEIENPGENIPKAMIGSLLLTTALYVLIVFVAIGVAQDLSPGGNFVPEAGEEVASMAYAAEAALGETGALIIVAAALLALASTANAGLLSASRYPFAMARDDLAPDRFETVSERFNTPVLAVLVTGGAIMVMVATLPIETVAKFGSAFQIIVFILVNLALVGFREGAVEEYDPEFTSPLYPWMQIVGMVGGFIVLTQIGLVPFAGAMLIVAIAIVYYYAYVRNRIDREGAARDAVRRNIGETALERTRELFESDAEYDILVGITENTSEDAKRDMLRMATDLGRLRTTVVSVIEFLDIPHRVFAEDHAEVHEREIPEWLPTDPDEAPEWFPDEQRVRPATRPSGGVRTQTDTSSDLSEQYGTTVEYREIDSEDHKRAMVDVATYERYDLLMLERRREDLHRRLFGGETDWLLRNAPCDVLLVEDRGFDGADEIAVVTARGVYDPLKILIADAIAEETGATINLMQAIPEDPPAQQRETIEEYHNELISICTVDARSTIIEADDNIAGLARFAAPADLLITGVESGGLTGQLFGRPGHRLVDSVDCTALMVQTHDDENPHGIIGRFVMRYIFD